MEPRSRASTEQYATLVAFMESHGDLSKSHPGLQGRITSDKKWKELANLLNSLRGGVKKSPDKWKKVWADWKTKTKKKAHLIGTRDPGDGQHSRLFLNTLEERVITLMRASMTGVLKRGLSKPPQQQATDVEENSILFVELPYDDALPPSPMAPSIPLEPIAPVSESTLTSTPRTQKQLSETPPQVSSQQQNSSSLPQYSAPPNQSTSPTPTSNTNNISIETSSVYHRKRRKRGQTPFDRAASEFVAVEEARLRFEELREANLHEREVERLRLEGERLRLEGQRIETVNALTSVLSRLADVAERYLHT